MTNRVEFVKENLGSGSADWHRDIIINNSNQSLFVRC